MNRPTIRAHLALLRASASAAPAVPPPAPPGRHADRFSHAGLLRLVQRMEPPASGRGSRLREAHT